MDLLTNKNKANNKMHAHVKIRCSHDTGICCISIFLAYEIYLLAKRKKN